MKTKFIGIASMLALLAACEQDKYELDNLVPEEYNKVLYIKEYGTPELTLYNADEKSSYSFTVNMGGKDFQTQTAACDIRTLTQAEVDRKYSVPEGANYKVLTKGYSIDNLHLDFATEEFYKTVTVSMLPKIIEAEMNTAPNSTWVLPICLYSESDRVNAAKSEIFMKLIMKSPSVGFNGAVEQLVKYENGESQVKFVEFGIDAENQWGLTCTFEVDEEYAAANYPEYQLLPKEYYEFSGTMQLNKGQQTGDLLVTLNGKRLEWGDYVLPIRLTSEPISSLPEKNVYTMVIHHNKDWEITGKYEERREDPSWHGGVVQGYFRNLLDGDPNTFWESDWNGDTARDMPVILVIDTKEEQFFSKVGILNRGNDKGQLGKHKYTVEFYVSSDPKTWWNFDHDKAWNNLPNKEEWSHEEWKIDTNWESQENWKKVGQATMKSLHFDVESFDLDSSIKGRYFIIKVLDKSERGLVEFAEIYLEPFTE